MTIEWHQRLYIIPAAFITLSSLLNPFILQIFISQSKWFVWLVTAVGKVASCTKEKNYNWMTSEALKNTVYIIHATLINFSNFYHVKFIIKFIYHTHLHFSIFDSVLKFSAQNATESSWSRLQWQVLYFSSFYRWKIRLLYLLLHLII